MVPYREQSTENKQVKGYSEETSGKSPEMFYRNAVLKNFATFTGKHLCWSLVLNKFAGLQGKMLFLILLKCAAIRKIFKACVRHFLTNFCFSPNDSPSKTMKDVLFHLKSAFRSQDIHIFVFSSSPLSLPVSHCLRAWSKINLKSSWRHQLSK